MGTGGQEQDVAVTASLADPGQGGASQTGYLLVIENGSSSIVELPAIGVIVVGRGNDVDLKVDHSSVSRRHARIVVESGDVRVSDLDSHNGTRVNGEPIVRGARAVVTGDVVAIGEVVLVVHAPVRRPRDTVASDEASWRRRLELEVERSLAYRRPLAVLAISNRADRDAMPTCLRGIDLVGRGDDGMILALLPEAPPEVAGQLAERIAQELVARVGIATAPLDAIDADSLVFLARAAVRARVADAPATAAASAAIERRTFDDREVLLCHPAMIRVFDLLARLAAADLPVLIIGETGAGKENAAFAVHHHSQRRGKPFIAVNCAALPEHLVESQLFGHDRGAFTGATAAKAGLLESVAGGSLFLDEIGELSLAIQAKLLRAIETQRITRLGEHKERAIDCRFVAATHRQLDREVAAGRFREDLYFRLGAAKVFLPPLRERRCDIPLLFRELLARACRRAGRETPVVTPAAMHALLSHAWPGNVRELNNVAAYLAATVVDEHVEPSDLPELDGREPELAAPGPSPLPPESASPGEMRKLADEIAELERARMVEALALASGVKTRAAQLLGMPIRTFTLKVKQLKL